MPKLAFEIGLVTLFSLIVSPFFSGGIEFVKAFAIVFGVGMSFWAFITFVMDAQKKHFDEPSD